jgi:hypothetical protein
VSSAGKEPADALSERAQAVLARAYQLARGELAGIDDAAKDLASLSEGDAAAVSTARREVLARLLHSHAKDDQQVAPLLRRAIEVGGWQLPWSNTNPVP